MATGIGHKFDVATITSEGRRVVGQVKRDAELVAESIHRILLTAPGERVFAPSFGSRIREVLFEVNDFTTITLGSFFVADAIETYEPRVIIEEITPRIIGRERNVLQLEVLFRLRDDQEQLFGTVVNL